MITSSVIREKGEFPNWCFKKAKHAKISEKQTFLTPWYAQKKSKRNSVSGGKKCLFFGNFGMLCFLETPVLKFALLPYYRQLVRSLPCLMFIPHKNHKNNVFDIASWVKFCVIIWVNNGKYLKLLPTPLFANSLRCQDQEK